MVYNLTGNSHYISIAGESDGTFNGYYWAEVPTTPTLITPTNNSIVKSAPVTLSVSSNSTDPIDYYFFGGTSPTAMSYLGQGTPSEFRKQKTITITTAGTTVPAIYQTKINVTYESEMQNDFDDIRFYHKDGTSLSYWIEEQVNGSYANVYVKLLDAITAPSSDYIYLRYGNSTLTSESNGPAVFTEYSADDSLTGWTLSGTVPTLSTVQVKRGTYSIRINGINGGGSYIGNNSKMHDNSVIEVDMYDISTDTTLENVIHVTLNAVDKGNYYIWTPTSTTHRVYRNGASFFASSTARTTGWSRAKITLNGTNISYYANDVLMGSRSYTYNGPVLVIGDNGADTHYGETYIDTYRVRKYIANEPTISTSSAINITTGSYSWDIEDYGTYYWTANANSGYGNSSNMTTAQFTLLLPPTLYYPSNGSTILSTFPPLTYDINFTWLDTGAPYYRLVVAEESGFVKIPVDTIISTNYSEQSLITGITYYWRVYSYTGADYSYSSDAFYFDLTGNSTASGPTIEGVVFGGDPGAYVALSNAEVTIYNATWSDSDITGSNGYYQFTGLNANTTYYLQAKKDLYLDSAVSPVTAETDPVTFNFYLRPDRTSEEWRHYVKFIVQSLFGTKYRNVGVTVYEGDSVIALYTGVTGSDGSATFVMNRQTRYRITFINATQGINKEIYLYPKDEKYIILVSTSSTINEWDTPLEDGISISVTKSEINATAAYINVSYIDYLADTSSLQVYINQTNISDVINQTVIDSWVGPAGNGSHSFIISNYSGNRYYVHIIAVHGTYGTIDRTYSVTFGEPVGITGIPDKVWLYVAVLFMVFTGGLFTKSSSEMGAVIVCIEGWIFFAWDWFDSVNETAIAGGLALATVVSIIAVINEKNKAEGFE